MAIAPEPAQRASTSPSSDLHGSGARHRSPEGPRPAPLGGPRHRATADDGARLRIAAPQERGRPGRHAAPEDDEPARTAAAEDPLDWLGFRFETA